MSEQPKVVLHCEFKKGSKYGVKKQVKKIKHLIKRFQNKELDSSKVREFEISPEIQVQLYSYDWFNELTYSSGELGKGMQLFINLAGTPVPVYCQSLCSDNMFTFVGR